ncbi:MAG: primosomal protein N' [Planctomycetes bacterium]|nr:primosomal protein N' [Planctomycetota bacterium]
MAAFADIALSLPVDRLFTYAVPLELRERVRPGCRVRVPFQSREVGGTCVRVSDARPRFEVRPVLGLVEPDPLFSEAMLRLCGWIARRYGAGFGEVLDAALPFAVRSGGKRRTVAVAFPLLGQIPAEKLVAELEERFPKQARVLRILAEAGEPLELRELQQRAKVGASPVLSLQRRKALEIRKVSPARDPLFSSPVERAPDIRLSAPQEEALRALSAAIAAERHAAFLLFGVTSSGKTEVYLRALADVVRRGRQGIVLVPEIALTPQTVARFRARFARVAVLHSNLTDAERHEQWRAIQQGKADVIIGARSAVFAPAPALGIVIIDEEHEGTFKQQNAPRYDAREVARARARFERALLLLGSATPSLESYQRALSGRLGLLRLPGRVAGGSFPETIVADLGKTVSVPGKPRILSDRLRAAMIERLARGDQVILFLNRRGYATAAICRNCGASIKCPHCAIVLVYHRRIGRIVCHYCGHEGRLPQKCAACGGLFRLAGCGTERVEEEVRQALPEASVARMDSDSMKGRGAHEKVLAEFRRGAVGVLVGTQMIAKGLDFPNVTLVGIVSADATLHLPDYRAAERTFGLISQVAGRAGRGEKGGMVIVQTHEPEHFAIQLALRSEYERFAEIELAGRRKDGYPPFGHLARVIIQGPREAEAERAARALRDLLGEWIADGVTALLGPAPAPIAVINGQYRFHVVAKSRWQSGIRQFVKVVRSQPRPGRRLRILLDVDPLSML